MSTNNNDPSILNEELAKTVEICGGYNQEKPIGQECLSAIRQMDKNRPGYKENLERLYGVVCLNRDNRLGDYDICMEMCHEFNDALDDTCKTALHYRCSNVKIEGSSQDITLEDMPECACFLPSGEYLRYINAGKLNFKRLNLKGEEYLEYILRNDLANPQCYFKGCVENVLKGNYYSPKKPISGCLNSSVCIQEIDLGDIRNIQVGDKIRVMQECFIKGKDVPITPIIPGIPIIPGMPGDGDNDEEEEEEEEQEEDNDYVPPPIPPTVPLPPQKNTTKKTGTIIAIVIGVILIIGVISLIIYFVVRNNRRNNEEISVSNQSNVETNKEDK